MMKSTVFENWMNYVSDGYGEELGKILDNMAQKLENFGLATGICDCGNVVTSFELQLENGQELSLPAYAIYEDTDGTDARDIVEANYEIYIGLLLKLFGIEVFKDWDNKAAFAYYLNEITELIEKAFGKVPDTGDCATCSMCCHASADREVE